MLASDYSCFPFNGVKPFLTHLAAHDKVSSATCRRALRAVVIE
jgi:hypothetical protein